MAKMKSMVTGEPVKLVLLFSIPIFLGFLLQQFYAIIDAIIVGQYLGEDALGAVGNTGPIVFMVQMFTMGATQGFSAIVAQRFGANDLKSTRRSVGVGITLSFIISAVLTALSIGFLDLLLQAIKTPSNLYEDTRIYTIIVFSGVIFTMFYNFACNTLRAIGDTKTPFLLLLMSVILNIGLDIMFISPLKMGVAGAAWATIISQAAAAVACLLYMFIRYKELRISKSDLILNKVETIIHIKLGFPMAFQFSVLSIGMIILQSVVNQYGSAATTGVTAASKIENIFMTPMNAVGTAMATFVGQNYGAKQYQRIKSTIYKVLPIAMLLGIICSLTVIFTREQLISLFLENPSEEVLKYADTYLLGMSIGMPFLTFIFYFRNVQQGFGDSLAPFIVGIIELLTRGGGAIVFNIFWGFIGLSVATPFAWFCAGTGLIIKFILTIRRPEFRTKENPSQGQASNS